MIKLKNLINILLTNTDYFKSRPSVNKIKAKFLLTDYEVTVLKSLRKKLHNYTDDLTCIELQDLNSYTYVFKNDLYILSIFDLESILSSYSSLIGKEHTLKEVASLYNIDSELLAFILKCHEFTHSDLPLTNLSVKNILDMNKVENIVAEEIIRKSESIKTKVNKKGADTLKKDAEKWNKFEESVINRLIEIMSDKPYKREVPELVVGSIDPFCFVVGLSDLHYGKYSNELVTGKTITREKTRADVLKAASSMKVNFMRYSIKPERIIIPIGSDWFNSDNLKGTTTLGTQQSDDGGFEEIFIEGCYLALDIIELFRDLSPNIELVFMQGNHDAVADISLLMFLKAWYRNDERITLSSNLCHRQYTEYGNTLIGFTHGDIAKIEKLPTLMATEASKAWGEKDHKVFFTGNYHYELAKDFNGVRVYQIPSLSNADRWHYKNGYTISERMMTGYVIDKKLGVIATLYTTLK